MMKASFPPIKCTNGHFHAATDDECPMCHAPTTRPGIDTDEFCKCGMVRPQVIETTLTKMIVHPSKVCYWCGNVFAVKPTEELFNY